MPQDRVDANPTKAFFVNMITRDIRLEDCILDLIDNSIDGAWNKLDGVPTGLDLGADFSPFQIDVTITNNRFEIEDNCGGIDRETAQKYAFTFGRKGEHGTGSYNIGVYGIGMKRAVFKIGRDIEVKSTFGKRRREAFRVPINVSDWLASDDRDWDFPIEKATPKKESGVLISVTDLYNEVSDSFENPAFEQNLRRTISRDYALHIKNGLGIRLNGKAVKGWAIEFLESDEFIPMRYEYERDGVRVAIVAGMAEKPPENAEPDDSDTDRDSFGWSVACNGRIVLAADKSETTGWGLTPTPKWHPQYRGFLGIVFFTSTTAADLPLTTTKRSVDESSTVYLEARKRMRDVISQWTRYTNARKNDPETAQAKERQTIPRALPEITQRRTIALPVLKNKAKANLANIAYAEPVSRVRKLGEAFGDSGMSFRDVGKNSFDYAYEELVGAD